MYSNLVFAGGGNRCFWQAGFWQTFIKHVDIRPENVASVSAGSAISCAIFAGKIEETLEATIRIQRNNTKNRYWSNALKGENIHPHFVLYRKIIFETMDEESLNALKAGPANRVLLAEIPKWLGPRSAVLVGLASYQMEKKLYHPVHPTWGQKLGFKSRFVPLESCDTVEALADLILCSSCTPPFTPIMRYEGDAVLDGGMVDNVPVHGIDTSKKTLVLLSRPYQKLPESDAIQYVAPLKKVPVESWDYTSPDAVEKTFRQGQTDAEHYLRQIVQ